MDYTAGEFLVRGSRLSFFEARPDVQEVHHRQLDPREGQGLGRSLQVPRGNGREGTEARDREHRPSRLVLLRGVLPCRSEGWDGSHHGQAEADEDADGRIVESQPEGDSQKTEDRTENIQQAPSTLAVPQGEHRNQDAADGGADDLTVDGSLGVHAHHGDYVQDRPDDPGYSLGLGWATDHA